MHFQHSPDIWSEFPALVPGVLAVDGISRDGSVDARVAHYNALAAARLATGPEGEFPEIQAWRRAFSKMGLKPTQYRCASESLLRRYRKEGALPEIHPLIDLCNAISIAFAVPIAVFDAARIQDHIEVRHAAGEEIYDTFAGGVERPEPGEVIFADAAGRAHARRWTNRQSGYSPVRDTTTRVLIVAEALHASAAADVARLVDTVADELGTVWSTTPTSAILSPSAPRFDF